MNKDVYPGKNKKMTDGHFSPTELKIIDKLADEFYVTNGGSPLRIGINSEYNYVIVKPTAMYGDMFNLQKEIIILFSPYSSLQARTFDAFEHISKRHTSLRIEKICNVLISCDNNVEDSLHKLMKNEPESQIVIPFSYQEMQDGYDNFFIRNRFRKYFYTRDLFAFEAPLKKDIYFFGRTDLIQEIINRCKSGENSGLFGLRKTGKTSLINGIKRNLLKEKINAVIIDCQNTSFNQRRWYEAIYYICDQLHICSHGKINKPSEGKFTEKNASDELLRFLKQFKKFTENPAFLIFDEIENISVKTSPVKHWNEEADFVLFWQTLRSIFQSNNELLSYLIVGTNPSCIETPKINTFDNPIFNHVKSLYIPGFSVSETTEMTNKLGLGMGIHFNSDIFTLLTQDFGGHPFLMRHLCSLITTKVSGVDRPVQIGRTTYESSQSEFTAKNYNYIQMIIGVLQDFYPDEYEMLRLLALNDLDSFNELVTLHPPYIEHLLGYGIIRQEFSGYEFNIQAVKNFIQEQAKYKKIGLSIEEKRQEISSRRNSVEIKLRKLVKVLLKTKLGEKGAKSELLRIFGKKRKSELAHAPYNDLFNPNKSEIYFSDLSKVIIAHWDIFENIFSKTQKDTFTRLEFINSSRIDAHAKDLSDDDFQYFRACMSSIEEDLENAF